MPQKPPVEHLELGLFGHARALITIKEAATALIVSEQKVRDWADVNVEYLKGVNIGDGQDRIHLRINRSSAEALSQNRAVNNRTHGDTKFGEIIITAN